MTEFEEKRQKIRVKIAGALAGRLHATVESNLLDLSATGARIEHFGLLRKGTTCSFEFPAELGGHVLSARIIRNSLNGKRERVDGVEHVCYESGITFVEVTEGQEAALAKLLS